MRGSKPNTRWLLHLIAFMVSSLSNGIKDCQSIPFSVPTGYRECEDEVALQSLVMCAMSFFFYCSLWGAPWQEARVTVDLFGRVMSKANLSDVIDRVSIIGDEGLQRKLWECRF